MITNCISLAEFIAKGNSLLDNHRLDEAASIFLKARERYPEVPEPLERLGRTAFLRKDIQAMLDFSMKLIAEFPDNIWGYTRAIDGLRDLGKLEEAQTLAESMVKLFPEEFRPYGRLGHLAMLRNDHESSIHWNGIIVKKFPYLEHGYQGQYQSLIKLGRISEARTVMKLGKKRIPNISFSKLALWSARIGADQSIGHFFFDYTELNIEFWKFLSFIYESACLQDLKPMLILAKRFSIEGEPDFLFFLETLTSLITTLEADQLNANSDRLVVNAVTRLAQNKCNLFFIGNLLDFLRPKAQNEIKEIYEIIITEYWEKLNQLDLSPKSTGLAPEYVDSNDHKIWFLHLLSSAFYWLEGYTIHKTGQGLAVNYKRSQQTSNDSNFDLRSILVPESLSFMDNAFKQTTGSIFHPAMQRLAGNEFITILFVSSLYKPFFPLWHDAYSTIGEGLIVIALDQPAYAGLTADYPKVNIIPFFIISPESPTHPKWLWKLRLLFVQAVLDAGHNALLTGVDTILLKNPVNLFKATGSDIVSIHHNAFKKLKICGDLVYIRNTLETRHFIRKAINLYRISFNDQSAMNALINQHGAGVTAIDVDSLSASTYEIVELGIRMAKLKAPIFVYDIKIAENKKYGEDVFFYFFPGELRTKLLHLEKYGSRIRQAALGRQTQQK